MGAAISVGVSLATNEVNNHVSAYIANAAADGQSVQTRTGGDITISATEHATIHALGVAASAALGGGLVGVSFAGAGVDVTNVILNKTNAYIDESVVGTRAAADDRRDRPGRRRRPHRHRHSPTSTPRSARSQAPWGWVRSAAPWPSAWRVAENLIGCTLDGSRRPGPRCGPTSRTAASTRSATSAWTADADPTIVATVVAGSVALAAGVVAIGGAGAGASTHNRVRTLVEAFIDGDAPTDSDASGITRRRHLAPGRRRLHDHGDHRLGRPGRRPSARLGLGRHRRGRGQERDRQRGLGLHPGRR